jgi:hypothetical protein
MLSPLLNGSLKMACGLQSETKRDNHISNEELVTMQARKYKHEQEDLNHTRG